MSRAGQDGRQETQERMDLAVSSPRPVSWEKSLLPRNLRLVPLRPSTDCMRLTDVMDSDLLYSVYGFQCSSQNTITATSRQVFDHIWAPGTGQVVTYD